MTGPPGCGYGPDGMVVVIRIEEIDRSSVPQFQALLADAARAYGDASDPTLVLDLRPVRLLDSSGIRALIDLERSIGAAGGRIELQAEGVVQRVLDVTGLWERLAAVPQ